MNPFNIQEQNPHFSNNFLYDVRSRRLEKQVWGLIDDKRIISIIGLRRTGKSSLLKRIVNRLIEEKEIERDRIYLQ